MRAHYTVVAALLGLSALALVGCKGSYVIPCTTSSFCSYGAAPGECVSSPSSSAAYCAFADATCPSGMRFDATAGDGLADQCVAASINRDGGADAFDLSPSPPDLTPVIAPVTFFQAPTYSTGASPSAVLIADFNHDLHGDVAVTNAVDNTVSIFLAADDLTGALQPPVSYNVGHNPTAIASADLNGDSKLDLAIANTGDGTVSVLIGKGDGTFAASVAIAIPSSPIALALVSLAAGSGPAIVTANSAGGSYSLDILLNQGGGQFAMPVSIPLQAPPYSIAGGILTGSGFADLVVGTSGGLDIFFGKGDGTFANGAPTQFGLKHNVTGVALSSVYGQAQPLDLVFTSSDAMDFESYQGDGQGNFINETVGAHLLPAGFAVGDFDNDGLEDIAVATKQMAGTGDLSVFLGFKNAPGNFIAQEVYSVGPEPSAVAVGEINADNQLDIAVIDPVQNTVAILLGNGDGTFQGPTESATGLTNCVIGDVDGDGLDDAVGLGQGNNQYGSALNSAAANGRLKALGQQSLGGAHAGLALADFNGDGKLDLTMTDPMYGDVELLSGDASGMFHFMNNSPGTDGGPGVVIAGDIGAPGKIGVVVGTTNNGMPTVDAFPGNGQLTISESGSNAVPAVPTALAIADLNGDGIPDLVVGYEGGVSVILGGLTKLSTMSNAFTLGMTVAVQGIAIADLNGDGFDDVLAVSKGAISVSLLLGDGAGNLAAPITLLANSSNPVGVAIADFNGDGKLDFVTANSVDMTGLAGATVFLGDGKGAFPVRTNVPILHGATSGVGVGNFNKDTEPDLALDLPGGGVFILLNTSK